MIAGDDSISTLVNAITATSRFLPRVIGATPRVSPGNSELSISDHSNTTMGSRVSQIEEKLSILEVNVKDVITNSMEEMLKKFINNQSGNTSVGQEDLS